MDLAATAMGLPAVPLRYIDLRVDGVATFKVNGSKNLFDVFAAGLQAPTTTKTAMAVMPLRAKGHTALGTRIGACAGDVLAG